MLQDKAIVTMADY